MALPGGGFLPGDALPGAPGGDVGGGAGGDVISDHGPEVGLANPVVSDHGPEVGLANGVVSDHGPRVGIGNLVVSDHGAKVELLPATYGGGGGGYEDPGNGLAAFDPTEPAEPASTWLAPINQTGEDLTLANVFRQYGMQLLLVAPQDSLSWDLTPYVVDYSITHKRSEPATANFVLADYDRKFLPFGGELSGYLKGDNLTDANVVRRKLIFRLYFPGLVWESPHWLQNDKDWDFEGQVPRVTLTCTDFSEMLLGDNMSMNDFISTPGHIYKAKEIITTILRTYGVTNISLDFDDYEVPKFPPKGSTPLDWVKSMLWVKQAEWFFDRDTFRAQRRYSGGNVLVRDIYHMRSVKFKQSILNLRNEFVIRKTAAVSEVLAEFEYWSPDVPGFIGGDGGITFTASRNCRIVVEDIVAGGVINVVWWSGGIPISTMPALGPYVGPTPVDKVVATYLPAIPFPAGVKAHIKGFIMGEAAGADYYPPGVAKAFTVTVKDTTNQATYGIRREATPMDATYVPNVATAHELGLALIDEAKRTMVSASWVGVLFPLIMPGMSATIYATMAGYAVAGAFYVESITKRGSFSNGKGEHYMEVETSHFDS